MQNFDSILRCSLWFNPSKHIKATAARPNGKKNFQRKTVLCLCTICCILKMRCHSFSVGTCRANWLCQRRVTIAPKHHSASFLRNWNSIRTCKTKACSVLVIFRLLLTQQKERFLINSNKTTFLQFFNNGLFSFPFCWNVIAVHVPSSIFAFSRQNCKHFWLWCP